MKRWLLVLLLLASVGFNVWQGWQLRKQAAASRQGVAQMVWGADYALNGLAQSLNNPQADWDNPGFRASLFQMMEWARLYSVGVVAASADNPKTVTWQVANSLNRLSMDTMRRNSAAQCVAGATRQT